MNEHFKKKKVKFYRRRLRSKVHSAAYVPFLSGNYFIIYFQYIIKKRERNKWPSLKYTIVELLLSVEFELSESKNINYDLKCASGAQK